MLWSQLSASTHAVAAADVMLVLWQARTVIRNALFFGGGKWSSQLLPWATYTEPEVAHVGAYGHELEVNNLRKHCLLMTLFQYSHTAGLVYECTTNDTADLLIAIGLLSCL